MAGATHSLGCELHALLGADGLPVGLEAAVADLPWQATGRAVEGFAYTAFSIVWHVGAWTRAELALAPPPPQAHRLWPARGAPLAESEWRIAVTDALRCLEMVGAWIDTSPLLAPLPGHPARTFAGEIALVAVHTAYHIAQIVDYRALIGLPLRS